MLSGNLATRPFYNERLVQVVLIGALGLAAVWTATNVVSLYSLSRRGETFREAIASESSKAAAARAEAQGLRSKLDGAEVAGMARAASEANQLIAHRAFSWTALFDHFEATLPPDVRLVHVQPQVDQEGRLLVAMTVISKSVEDLDEFIARLEASGNFTGVLSRQDETLEDDTIQSSLQGYYREEAKAPPASSQPLQAASPRPEASR